MTRKVAARALQRRSIGTLASGSRQVFL